MKLFILVLVLFFMSCSVESPKILASYEKFPCAEPSISSKFITTLDDQFVDSKKVVFEGHIRCREGILKVAGQESGGRDFLHIYQGTKIFTLHDYEVDSTGFGSLDIIGLNDNGIVYSIFEPNIFREILFGTPEPTVYWFNWRTGKLIGGSSIPKYD